MTHEMDDGLTRVLVKSAKGDQELAIDLIEANREINRLADEFKDRSDFAWVDAFAAWLEGHTQTKVRPALADKIADFCVAELIRLKKERMPALGGPADQAEPTLNLPSSTV